MAQQNIPKQADPKTSQYMNLLGVDYQSDTTEVSPLRSPEMVNMVSDLGGIPVKRYGYRQFGDAYEGVATIGGETWAVKKVAQGTTPETYKLYSCVIDVSGERVEEELLAELSPRTNCGEVKHVFGFQNSLYVLCENEWIEKDIEKGTIKYLGVNEGNLYDLTEDNGDNYIDLKMPDNEYIPTVYTMYKPNGKELVTLPQGVDLTGSTEGVNLLTPFRRVEYCVTTDTATATTFVIPNQAKIAARHNQNKEVPYKVEVLESSTYEWKALTAGTDYAVTTPATVACRLPDGTDEAYTDTTLAKIEFVSAPYTVVTDSGVDYLRFKDDNTKDVPSGVPNVRVTYAAFTEADGGTSPMTMDVAVDIKGTHDSVSRAYTVAGDGTANMTVTLSETPKGAVYIQALFDLNAYYAGGTGGTRVLKTANFFAGHIGERTADSSLTKSDWDAPIKYSFVFTYDGQRTISVTASVVSTPSGVSGSTCARMIWTPTPSVPYVPTVAYILDEPQSYTLPREPLQGTQVVVRYYRDDVSVYNWWFDAGTPSNITGKYYDGYGTIYISGRIVPNSSWTDVEYQEQRATAIRYSFDIAVAPAYYKDRRVDLLKSEAVTFFDARLFGGVGVHTYYSRASEPFKIDDNFYFDVDNDVLTYTRASRYLAIITEDIGRNTIFLASGEYDSTLAMMVYSVRASNAGVGAVTPYVSGTLNDEPLFLSRTGIYGISTNYLSEKYAISRSGKINKHLCREPNLETAVGIAFNGYFYLSVNGNMYVLDGRHRDASRNGDNSYECYFFDNMPNITDMFVVDNRLLFSDGTFTYAWNDDLDEEYQYIDNAEYNEELQRWEGEAVACKWTSKLDGDGAPHYYKTLSKKGTMITIAPPMQTSCEVTLIKDAHDEVYLGKFRGDTFALSDSVMDAFTKKKIKKYKRLQFVIENKEAEPFGLISVVKTFTLGNYAKR